MTSLGFDLLDRHVVSGHADDVACTDATGSMTYAQLLDRSAALAGGLYVLGVRRGDEVAVVLPAGNLQVIVVCACIRLGAVPGAHGEVSILDEDGQFIVRMADHELPLDVVRKAGAASPAPSLDADEPGFDERVSGAFEDIVETLRGGGTVS